MANHEQRSLFTASEQKSLIGWGRSQVELEMDSDGIQAWKAAIAQYQRQVKISQAPAQGTLFDLAPTTVDAACIDPFSLKLHNFHFFEWPADRYPSTPCIYFAIDIKLPLILYIGETCKANQRWKGVHDCKRYVLNYQNLHRKYQLPTAVNTAFWWETPGETKQRLHLEAELIARWRSPFNKENWRFWGTPFVGKG